MVIESRDFQQSVQKQTGNTKKNSVRLLQLNILLITQKRQYRRLLQNKVVKERKVYSKLTSQN